MITEKYNHLLRYMTSPEAVGYTQTPQGHVVPNTNAEVAQQVIVKCRMEVEKALERTVRTEDGTFQRAVFTVYVPKGAIKPGLEPTNGGTVEVLNGNQVVGSGEVKRFYKARFNDMVWV